MNRYFSSRISFAGILAYLFLHSGCIYHTKYSGDTTSSLPFSMLRRKINTNKIKKGFGTIEVSMNGEKQRGMIELVNTTSDGSTLTFYSPFGGVIGSILLKNDTGFIHFQDRNIIIAANQPLDTLGFSWSQHLMLNDVITLLSGVIPSNLIDQPFVPDHTDRKGFSSIVVYTFEKNHIYLHFSLRLRKLKRIVLDYSANEKPFFIENSHFYNTIPRCIYVKKDLRNYCRVEYEKIVSD